MVGSATTEGGCAGVGPARHRRVEALSASFPLHHDSQSPGAISWQQTRENQGAVGNGGRLPYLAEPGRTQGGDEFLRRYAKCIIFLAVDYLLPALRGDG